MGRLFVAGVDDSETSMNAAIWAALNLATRPGDELHLLFTLPPATFYTASTGAWPTGPTAFGASLAQKEEDENRARATLARIKRAIQDAQAPCAVHTHTLPAAGGASGLGESIVVWAQQKQATAIVLGSRGMGAVKSTLMSVVGLGSVSHYCMHHSKLPVAVVRGREGDREKKTERRKVMVAVDDSDSATKALLWAVQEVVGPSDQVHLVSVALPVPYPAEHEAFLGPAAVDVEEFEAEYRGSLEHTGAVTERAAAQALHAKIVGDDAIPAHMVVTAEVESTTLTNLQYAERQAERAEEKAAAAGVDKARLFVKALTPEGGASDAGASIAHYAAANGVDVVVLGARGLGAMKRALLGFIGLGSVSDYVSRHVECPVVVVKE